ncbi:glycosyltransferase involved in cell wall biosynthesis [Pelomonas aquatica]|uniref:Glycosyltransferase involved in cell wall biosynthesis n=1 Tax=Pelomonas aquatica TaxID=431058 RepID=A0ABU1Z3G7_9BURK|nr:glycosyltransferase family 4 protein [Pelomonas aquatica]MDR7295150.1 glycosyltransferase involved in cell wall biosynthesis [Pelomonas aquatica]
MPVVLLPHQASGNIYIRELGRAYAELGWTPIYGPENLLEGNLRPDLLHLHWPEEFYRWRGEGTLAARAQHFLMRLQALRQAGVPMVWTVHNLVPHDVADATVDAHVYRTVIDSVDAVHHHCNCSIQAVAARYEVPPRVRQFVQAHGHYFSYPNAISRADARRELGIPAEARVFLQFGQIRGYKGLDLLLSAFDQLELPGKFLLVAGLYNAPTGPGAWRERLRLAWRKRTDRKLLIHGRSIDSDRIQVYMNAADCVVLSHTAGLNSGVAVLGMSFGRPVVGPRLGCIGETLGEENNFTYPPGDVKALTSAMLAAAQSPHLSAQGQNNRLACESWQWTRIAGAALHAAGLNG